jgi:hypothetical protein
MFFFYHGTVGKNPYGVYFLLYIYICTKGSTKAQITSSGVEEEHKPEYNIHKHQEAKVASQSKRA